MPISDFQSRADVDHTQKIFFYEKVLKLPFDAEVAEKILNVIYYLPSDGS